MVESELEITMSRMSLGEQLVAAGLLTEAQLELAQREQHRSGVRLVRILVQLGFLSPDALAEFLGKKAGSRSINLRRTTIDKNVIALVPHDVARRCVALPISRENGTLTVALADPFDVTAVDTLQQICGLSIEVVTAPERDILNCLDIYYTSGDTIGQSIDKVLLEKEQDQPQAQSLETVLSRMANKAEDAPVIRLVQQIITRAVYGGASDIHFEPEEGVVRVRRRVDGILFQDVLIPKTMQSAVNTRMKILADLDLTETRVPQDGRATILVGGRQVNLRVSSLPTAFGENIVARILDPSSQVLTIKS